MVVIGGGMAAARLVHRLTAAPDGPGRVPGSAPLRITVLAEEPHPPYNRVLLTEVLAGRYPPRVIALPAPGNGAEWRGGVRAVRIDRAARRVRTGDGRETGYDVLVLATGARPVLPPLPGVPAAGRPELPDGLRPLRTLDDCTALASAVRPGLPAVVVGGGPLGVSAARALAGRGARVLLAERHPHLMHRQLDPEAAALLRDHLTGLGVEVRTGCPVGAVRTRPAPAPGAPRARRVTAVALAGGPPHPAALVVAACGARPRTGLARAAGLAVGTGIRVDGALRTSDPRIHALGDCAEHDGTVYGLATPALEQADVLAGVLTGDGRARYTGTRSLTRLTLSGDGFLDLAAFGDPVPRPGDDVARLSDPTRGTYRKVVVRGDRLVGGVLVGALGSVGALARAWEGTEPLPADRGPLLHLLTDDGGS
nr:FAD-dependent oxidoreductase [Streptomyces rhizoryzae]